MMVLNLPENVHLVSRTPSATMAAHLLGRSALAAHAAAGRVGSQRGVGPGRAGPGGRAVERGSSVTYHGKKRVISMGFDDEKWWFP